MNVILCRHQTNKFLTFYYACREALSRGFPCDRYLPIVNPSNYLDILFGVVSLCRLLPVFARSEKKTKLYTYQQFTIVNLTKQCNSND